MKVKCPKCGREKRTYSKRFHCCGMSFASSENDAYPSQTPKLQNQGDGGKAVTPSAEPSKIKKEEVSVKRESSLPTRTSETETAQSQLKEEKQELQQTETLQVSSKVQNDKLEILVEDEAVQKANLDDWKYQCKSCGALFNKFDDESDPHCPNPKCNEALSLP